LVAHRCLLAAVANRVAEIVRRGRSAESILTGRASREKMGLSAYHGSISLAPARSG
jgi:hypothetical protein